MWKIVLAITGLLVGAFVGLELVAWVCWSSFDGGGLAGLFVGVPAGALAGCALGLLVGWRVDRRGGLRQLQLRPRHLLAAALVLALIAALVAWMSTIRPFYWIQT